jgi:hypothetical protein
VIRVVGALLAWLALVAILMLALGSLLGLPL